VVEVPNKSLNYLYPLHKPFNNHKAAFHYRPSRTALHLNDKLTVHIELNHSSKGPDEW